MSSHGGFAGRRVVVAGAGVSGRSAAEALLAEGAEVTVIDAAEQRLAALASLEAAGARLVVGGETPPEGTELVVTSPGWRPTAPLLAASAAAGIEIIGEVELAWRLDPARPWLAVTGTNGKTTTVGMLESILRAAGLNAVACGNVGLPVVDAVRSGAEVLAVELSSFQLHWQSSLNARASVVLNIAEDHLDWHGSLEEYARAKGRIYAGDPVAVFNADDAWSTRLAAGKHDTEDLLAGSSSKTEDLLAGSRIKTVGFTLGEPKAGYLGVVDGVLVDHAFGPVEGDTPELAAVSDVRPAGPHNVSNALAAAALARAYGVRVSAVRDGLRAYTPGAHRAVPVATVGGVTYVDDSKATNPHSAAASLRAHERAVWIAGGLLKGASVDALVAEVAPRLAGVVLLGTDAGEFATALARHAPEVPVHQVLSRDDDAMTEAVRAAGAMAGPGTAVVLAPAAASMDMFLDYAHRGRAFSDAVQVVVRGQGAAESPVEACPGPPGRTAG